MQVCVDLMAKVEAAAPVQGTYEPDLAARACRLSRIVEGVFVDSDGLVVSGVNPETLGPFTLGEAQANPYRAYVTHQADAPHDLQWRWVNYEETGMATGDYLMARVEEYAATGRPRALIRARRTVRAIDKLMQVAARREPGWLPKPWGGMDRAHEVGECSADQHAKLVLGLERFAQDGVAGAPDARTVQRLVLALAGWWIRHAFAGTYMGRTNDWKGSRMGHGVSFLLYLMALSHAWSTEERFEHAYREVFDWCGGTLALDRLSANSYNLTVECALRLRALRPADEALWERVAHECWAGHVRDQNEDGSSTVRGTVRLNTGCRTACSAALLARTIGGEAHRTYAERLLRVFDRMEQFMHLPAAQELPDTWKAWTDVLSGHHYASWLLAYWRLRAPEQHVHVAAREDGVISTGATV